MQCATHADVETELACGKCGKAICPRCMIQTPVGFRCRDCAGVRLLPTYHVSGDVLTRAAGAALGAGLALGIAWWIVNPVTYFFFGVFVGLALGYATGELVSTATNRRAGPPLQAIAVGGVGLAYAIRLAGLFLVSDWQFDDLRVDLGGLIAVVLAAFVAAGRLR